MTTKEEEETTEEECNISVTDLFPLDFLFNNEKYFSGGAKMKIATIRADEIDWDEEGILDDIEMEKYKNEKGEVPTLHDFRLTVEKNGNWKWEVEQYEGTWTHVSDGIGEYDFPAEKTGENKKWKYMEHQQK